MADIKQKILFQMGTTGTQGASKSFAKMAAGAAAVGVAVGLAAKGLDKLYDSAIEMGRLLDSLTTDMSEFNDRTGGMIDTVASFRGAIQLQEADLRLNKEQMAALGVAAAEMNRKLGGGPEGATTQFNALIKGVRNARETALIPFGIELSQTADKAAASREAIDKLTAKFSGISVEAETAKEKMFAFNNSLGTIVASEFNGFLEAMNKALFDQTDIMNDVLDGMTSYEADIISTKGAISEWMFTQEGFLNRMGRWGAWLKGDTDRLRDMNAEYRAQVTLLSQVAVLRDRQSALAERQAAEQAFLGAKGLQQIQAAAENYQRVLAKTATEDLTPAQFQSMSELSRVTALPTGKTAAKKVATGRGRATDTTPSLDITGEDFFAGTGIKRTRPGTSAFVSELEGLNAELGGLSTPSREGAARGQAQAAAQADIQRRQEHLAAIAELERESAKERAEIEKELAAKRLELQQESMGATANILGATSKLVGQNSEEAFNASKALAFSQNVVGTIQGAQSAFQAAQRLGPVAGPIVGAINAAAVTTAGVAAGRQILSTSFKSKTQAKNTTKQSSFPSGGSGVGGGDNNDTFNIAVVLNGATIQQDSIRQNQMEKQAGNPHFVMSDG